MPAKPAKDGRGAAARWNAMLTAATALLSARKQRLAFCLPAQTGRVADARGMPVAMAEQVSTADDGVAGVRLERSSQRGGSFTD
jgi:hypothetical protein